jgi:S-adenosylmethionine:tRNA ribosyltransferase-isomerase
MSCRPTPDPPAIHLSDFDYDLPESLIAQRPAPARSGARLLAVGAAGLDDRRFEDIPALIDRGDLLVLNDTRVVRSRLFGRRETGGRIEALVDQVVAQDEAWVLLRASHLPRPGGRLTFERRGRSPGDRPDDSPAGALDVTNDAGPSAGSVVAGGATVIERDDGCDRQRALPRFRLRFDLPVLDLLESAGHLPLPPYIRHEADADDAERYQTIYATAPGAVAAPTAGLHFDQPLFDALGERGVAVARITLHVGAGTFLPVRSEVLGEHRMHAERYRIGPEAAAAIAATRGRGGRIVAVGTTTLRALEASGGSAGDGETDLFIRPGYRFRVVDRLVTNFHLPRSTLLILVSAFAGRERIRRAYAHAVAERYRFFSYGDAMLLDRADAPAPSAQPAVPGAARRDPGPGQC